MTDRIVASRAFKTLRLAVRNIPVDRRGDLFMTAPARAFRNAVIELRDFDGVGIPASGEVKGVPEAVVGLHRVLAEEIMRRVAIVACCDRMVARLHPGVVLALHDMTIRARGRIIRQVGISLGIKKRVRGKTEPYSDQESERNAD